MCLALGLVTASPFAYAFASLPNPILWGFLSASAMYFVLAWSISSLLYPTVRVDPVRHVFRVRGREYTADELRRATLRRSANGTAAYTTLRLYTTDGRNFRILLHGRPFRGLAPESLRLLASFVAASDLHAPDFFTADQKRRETAMATNRHAVDVGRGVVLGVIEEVLAGTGTHGGVLPAADRPFSPEGSPGMSSPRDLSSGGADPFPADPLRTASASASFSTSRGDSARHPDPDVVLRVDVETDREFTVLTRTLVRRARTSAVTLWTGMGLWVLALAGLAADLGPRDACLAFAAVLPVLVAAAAITRAATLDLAGRRVRGLTDAWTSWATGPLREWGAPTVLLAPEARGAHRLARLLGWVSAVLAAVFAVAVVGGLTEPDLRVLLVPAVSLCVLAVVGAVLGFRSVRRDARLSAHRSASITGRRHGVASSMSGPAGDPA